MWAALRRETRQGRHVGIEHAPARPTSLQVWFRSMEHFYPLGKGVATFMCGPIGLLEDAALPALLELGFEDGRSVFAF